MSAVHRDIYNDWQAPSIDNELNWLADGQADHIYPHMPMAFRYPGPARGVMMQAYLCIRILPTSQT